MALMALDGVRWVRRQSERPLADFVPTAQSSGEARRYCQVSEDASLGSNVGEIRYLRPPNPQDGDTVTFQHHELRDILDLYGRKVAEGEWRDYAIDFSYEKATFSIFRRASEYPLYRVEKNPRLARKQGAYSVVAAGGLVLKRGHDLKWVLDVLDRKLKLVPIQATESSSCGRHALREAVS